MRLPRALAAWEAELSLFPEEVALGLGGVVARLALAIGPMRARAQRGLGTPDGYDGLSRRGDYARLVMTEWLLADEIPEEFVRRVAMGEHAFLARAFEQPASSRRSVVLFDAGPEQLGAPRVAQLAALVTFAQRAADARAELAWGTLQAHHASLAEAVTPAGVAALLDARTRNLARAADVEVAVRRAGARGAHDELWIVGSAALAEAAARVGASFVQIDDVLEPEAHELRVRVVPSRGAERGVVLELPSPQVTTRLLRDPFQVATSTATGADHAPSRAPGNVVFSADGRKIFARTDDGSLLSLALPGSPRAAPAPVARYRPPSGQRVVAAGWSRSQKRVQVMTQKGDGAMVLHTLSRRGSQSISETSFAALDPPAPAGDLAALYREREGAMCMLDACGRLLRLNKEADVDWISVVAVVSGSGRSECAAIALGEFVELVTKQGDAPVSTVRVPVQLARAPRVFFGARPPRWLAVVETGEDEWTLVRPEPGDAIRERWVVPAGREVCGVLETEWAPPKPALVMLDGEGQALRLFRPEGTEQIVTSEPRILHATVSPGARDIAYGTERGELVVHSLAARAVIARIAPSAPEAK